MSTFNLTSRSPTQTIALGKKIGASSRVGDTIALVGELGTGKTTFAKGVALGVGVKSKDLVVSPSFVIAREYQGKAFPLYHLDLYRLERLQELLTTGFEEYIWGDGVTVIEWAEKIEPFLPDEYLRVEFEIAGKRQRRIRLVPKGKRYIKMLRNMRGNPKS